MSRSVVAICVCSLVLLAGCSGIVADPDPATDRDRYDVPQSYAPGLGPEGLVDLDELVASHGQVVRGDSVTVLRRHSQRFAANGTVRYQSSTTRYEGHDERYIVRDVTAQEPLVLNARSATIRGWSNISTSIVSVVTDDRTQYGRYSLGTSDPSRRVRLAILLSSLEPERNGTATVESHNVTVLRADRGTASSAVARGGLANVSNVSLVVWVDDRGLIRGYRLTYQGRDDGSVVTVRETLWFEDLGSTTVPRPAWVDDALNRTCSPRSGNLDCSPGHVRSG